MEENETCLIELLKLLKTAVEDLNKVNHKHITTTIENAKDSIKKATTITQRMIFEKEHENQLSHITRELKNSRTL